MLQFHVALQKYVVQTEHNQYSMLWASCHEACWLKAKRADFMAHTPEGQWIACDVMVTAARPHGTNMALTSNAHLLPKPRATPPSSELMAHVGGSPSPLSTDVRSC